MAAQFQVEDLVDVWRSTEISTRTQLVEVEDEEQSGIWGYTLGLGIALLVLVFSGVRFAPRMPWTSNPWFPTLRSHPVSGPPSLTDWRWAQLVDAYLREHHQRCKDRAIPALWSSWARLGNVLRHHRWERLYRARIAPKAKEKPKAAPGPPARGGVPPLG